MSKIYVVKRRLRVADSEIVIPIYATSRREDAVEFAGKNHQAMTELLRYSVVSPIGEHMGSFGKLIDQLGVVGFRPEIEEVELEGSRIEVVPGLPAGLVAKGS